MQCLDVDQLFNDLASKLNAEARQPADVKYKKIYIYTFRLINDKNIS